MDYDNKGKIVPYITLKTYLTSHQFYSLESTIETQIKAYQDELVNKHGYSCSSTVIDQKLANFFIKRFAFRLRDCYTKQDLGRFVCFGNARCYENESVDPDNFIMSRPQVMKWFRQTITWKRSDSFIVNEDHSEILDEPVGKELYLISDDVFFLKYFLKYFKGEPFEGTNNRDNKLLYSHGIRKKVETSVENQKHSLISMWRDYSRNYISKCNIYYNLNKPKLNDLDDEEKEEEWNTVLKNMGICVASGFHSNLYWETEKGKTIRKKAQETIRKKAQEKMNKPILDEIVWVPQKKA